MEVFQKKVQHLLELADIRINGSRCFDIQVHNEMLFQRVIAEGSLGLGESYMEKWWDFKNLDELFYRIVRAELNRRIKPLRESLTLLKTAILNLQKPSRAFLIGEHHYDIGDDLYEAMLDKRKIYSCAYWNDTRSLDKAQEQKLDLIFQKLGLQKGMRVLDVGCGWGGALKFAAEKYGLTGVGVTVSVNQARAAADKAGLGASFCS